LNNVKNGSNLRLDSDIMAPERELYYINMVDAGKIE